MQVIAELGINACGNTSVCKRQIDEAKLAGADWVKFQIYITDKLYEGNESAPYYWDSKRGEFAYEQLLELTAYCENKIKWFASVFCKETIEIAENLKCPMYKIASRSVPDTDLLLEIKKLDKPVILSTGAWDKDVVDKAVDILDTNIAGILYCVPEYPTDLRHLDFYKMVQLREYGYPIGFSDHTQAAPALRGMR